MKNNLYSPKDFFAVARDEAEINNLLNTDIYKFMMLDFVLANPEWRDIQVKRKMTIRSKDIRTQQIIPESALIEQLEATKNISWVSEADLSYLRGMNRPDWERLFREDTLDFLKHFRLSDYLIGHDETGNYELEFIWSWASSILWEIYGLKIINSLYLYHYIRKERLTNIEFNQIINETLHRLYRDIEIFKQSPETTFSEFWTRRSASTDYQRMVYEILSWSLPGQCLWTSNVMIAREFWLANPKWTNAHELRMITTALYDEKEQIIDAMYNVDKKWAKHFPWLSVLLPDTYGTSFYFENCPEEVFLAHNGCRFDSKDPRIAIPEYVQWVLERWWNPQTKLWLPSDGLSARDVVEIHNGHKNSLGKLTFWVGTNLTNNTKNTFPRAEKYGPFWSFSVVVKPSEIQRPDGTWVSCVKLSDNPTKAIWETKRVEFFKEIFWSNGMNKKEVFV